jgi:uncharacterized membrane protein
MGGLPWTWILVLFGIGFLFWSGFRPQLSKRYREDPLDIARMRFARGEISSEELEIIITKL